MKLKIKKDFAFAHRGYDRREYVAGQEVEADDAEFIEVSVREGWASAVDDEKAEKESPENKGKKAAPENKGKGGK